MRKMYWSRLAMVLVVVLHLVGCGGDAPIEEVTPVADALTASEEVALQAAFGDAACYCEALLADTRASRSDGIVRGPSTTMPQTGLANFRIRTEDPLSVARLQEDDPLLYGYLEAHTEGGQRFWCTTLSEGAPRQRLSSLEWKGGPAVNGCAEPVPTTIPGVAGTIRPAVPDGFCRADFNHCVGQELAIHANSLAAAPSSRPLREALLEEARTRLQLSSAEFASTFALFGEVCPQLDDARGSVESHFGPECDRLDETGYAEIASLRMAEGVGRTIDLLEEEIQSRDESADAVILSQTDPSDLAGQLWGADGLRTQAAAQVYGAGLEENAETRAFDTAQHWVRDHHALEALRQITENDGFIGLIRRDAAGSEEWVSVDLELAREVYNQVDHVLAARTYRGVYGVDAPTGAGFGDTLRTARPMPLDLYQTVAARPLQVPAGAAGDPRFPDRSILLHQFGLRPEHFLAALRLVRDGIEALDVDYTFVPVVQGTEAGGSAATYFGIEVREVGQAWVERAFEKLAPRFLGFHVQPRATLGDWIASDPLTLYGQNEGILQLNQGNWYTASPRLRLVGAAGSLQTLRHHLLRSARGPGDRYLDPEQAAGLVASIDEMIGTRWSETTVERGVECEYVDCVPAADCPRDAMGNLVQVCNSELVTGDRLYSLYFESDDLELAAGSPIVEGSLERAYCRVHGHLPGEPPPGPGEWCSALEPPVTLTEVTTSSLPSPYGITSGTYFGRSRRTFRLPTAAPGDDPDPDDETGAGDGGSGGEPLDPTDGVDFPPIIPPIDIDPGDLDLSEDIAYVLWPRIDPVSGVTTYEPLDVIRTGNSVRAQVHPMGGELGRRLERILMRSEGNPMAPKSNSFGLPGDLIPPLEHALIDDGDAFEDSFAFYMDSARQAGERAVAQFSRARDEEIQLLREERVLDAQYDLSANAQRSVVSEACGATSEAEDCTLDRTDAGLPSLIEMPAAPLEEPRVEPWNYDPAYGRVAAEVYGMPTPSLACSTFVRDIDLLVNVPSTTEDCWEESGDVRDWVGDTFGRNFGTQFFCRLSPRRDGGASFVGFLCHLPIAGLLSRIGRGEGSRCSSEARAGFEGLITQFINGYVNDSLRCAEWSVIDHIRSLEFEDLPTRLVEERRSGGRGEFTDLAGEQRRLLIEMYQRVADMDQAIRTFQTSVQLAREKGELASSQAGFHANDDIQQGMCEVGNVTQITSSISSVFAGGGGGGGGLGGAWRQDYNATRECQGGNFAATWAAMGAFQELLAAVRQVESVAYELDSQARALAGLTEQLDSLERRVAVAAERQQIEERLATAGSVAGDPGWRALQAAGADRAREQLFRARKRAFVARRAIEFRLAEDMRIMSEDEPFVAAPAEWVGDVYTLDTEVTCGEEGGRCVSYAGEALLDHLNNLDDFVFGYPFERRYSEGSDVQVLSLANIAYALEPSQCRRDFSRAVCFETDYTWYRCADDPSTWLPGGYELAAGATCPAEPPQPCGDEANVLEVGACQDVSDVTSRPFWQNLLFKCVDLPLPVYGGTMAASGSSVPCEGFGGVEYATMSFRLPATPEGYLGDRLAEDNYNYRLNRLAVNLPGTALVDCRDAEFPSECYASGNLEYSLLQSGGVVLENYEYQSQAYYIEPGRIEHARALAAERYLTNPLSSADRALVADYQRAEWWGRPLGSVYTIQIHGTDEIDWLGLDDVQLLLWYDYWTRQE